MKQIERYAYYGTNKKLPALFSFLLIASILFAGCEPRLFADKPAIKRPYEIIEKDKPKLLGKIIKRESDSSYPVEQITFSYDENDRIDHIITERLNQYYLQDLKVNFDKDGRLLSLIYGQPNDTYSPGQNRGQMYTYNEQGQLIDERSWEGSADITEYTYDESGRRIRAELIGEVYSSVTDYYYENSNLPVRAVQVDSYYDGDKTTNISFTYDNQGRLLQECYSYEDGTMQEKSYDYDTYSPFVLMECTTTVEWGYDYYELCIPSKNGLSIYSLALFDPEIQVEDGSIVQIQTNDHYYEFEYITEEKPVTSIDHVTYEMRKEVIEFPLSNGEVYYSNTIEYPYFLGNSEAERILNEHYRTMIDSCRSNDIDADEQLAEELKWSESKYPYYINTKAVVTYNKNGAISIEEMDSMWTGGAHVYHYITGINYNITTGQELQYDDILIGSIYALNDALLEAFQTVFSEPDDYTLRNMRFSSEYALTEEGLCFYYHMGDAVPAARLIVPFTDDNSYQITLPE